jgi:hypothetical protein
VPFHTLCQDLPVSLVVTAFSEWVPAERGSLFVASAHRAYVCRAGVCRFVFG